MTVTGADVSALVIATVALGEPKLIASGAPSKNKREASIDPEETKSISIEAKLPVYGDVKDCP